MMSKMIVNSRSKNQHSQTGTQTQGTQHTFALAIAHSFTHMCKRLSSSSRITKLYWNQNWIETWVFDDASYPFIPSLVYLHHCSLPVEIAFSRSSRKISPIFSNVYVSIHKIQVIKDKSLNKFPNTHTHTHHTLCSRKQNSIVRSLACSHLAHTLHPHILRTQ